MTGFCQNPDEPAPPPWWLCPNQPRCPHAAVFHDVYDAEDLVPRCCAEGCDCGKKAADARMSRQGAQP